jgi:hypothetical protein
MIKIFIESKQWMFNIFNYLKYDIYINLVNECSFLKIYLDIELVIFTTTLVAQFRHYQHFEAYGIRLTKCWKSQELAIKHLDNTLNKSWTFTK